MDQNTWTFFEDEDNVFTNITPPKKEHPHLFERTYLRDVLNILRKWPSFRDYNYYLLDARRNHEFSFDDRSIVFYLSNENHIVPQNLDDARWVFTTYYPSGPVNGKILSIPLGVNGSVPQYKIKPFHERETDVFFIGNLNKRRLNFFVFATLFKWRNAINGLFGRKKLNLYIRFTRRFGSGLTPEAYGRMLANTKIALTPQGYDSDISFRFFEAARAGCILISYKQPGVWHFKPFPGYYVKSWHRLGRIIRGLLKNPHKADRVQKEMIDYYHAYCSEQSTADYIRNILENHSQS